MYCAQQFLNILNEIVAFCLRMGYTLSNSMIQYQLVM
jgi:hypothetical protein